DRIRWEPSLDGWHRVSEPEASGAMAEVEQDAPVAGLPEVVVQPAFRVDDRELLGEDVRVNITGPHMLQDQVGVRPFGRARPEIDHHRPAAALAGGDGGVDRRPRWMGSVPWVVGPVVGGLDADDRL